MNYLYLMGSGFLVSLITVWILGKKGVQYPGGSMMSGMMLSQMLDVNIWIGAICGILGWIIMLTIVTLLSGSFRKETR